ncbi:tetratricopeptide repeat protein [Planctomicrobium piriforme]|uniref:Tetratricopeptide repeat-containing protein n=1 Tax=Planctomicrobium piriforme TaxID=1576369 RepID=A0A1I3QSR0_9PLAN|nr:tetratricopeptide repeat protein [Planctomicrobium piriforme]SFJ37313.1 Tetratricopeptide repeat-containing protein [Planctomicrobium piriforme]
MTAPSIPIRLTFALFLSLLVAQIAPAAGEGVTVVDPPQRLIVVAEKARSMAGNVPVQEVPRGTILSVTRANANWRYSADCNGWIHLRDTVPVEKAVALFTTQIEKDPSAVAYQLRGIAWMSHEQWAKAAQDFEKAYDLGESSTNLHYNLGNCYERLGETAAALEEYDSILKTYPDEFPTALARGNLLLQQDQFAAALRDLDLAVGLDAKSAEAHNSRGIALRMLGRFPEAIDAYSKSLELDPQRADALCNRGFARKRTGNDQAALVDYDAALKLAPTSNAIGNDLAWLLATSPDSTLRNPVRAIELAEAVCKSTDNKNGDYLDTLAAAYASAGRYAAAEETAKLAVTFLTGQPELPGVQARLAVYQQKKPFIDELPSQEKPAGTPTDNATDK